MATKFSMTRDINGYNGFGLPASDTNYSAILAINTDTSLTVPSAATMGGASYSNKASTNGQPVLLAIIVSDPGESVWVAVNAAAAVPAGASFAATSSMLNPAAVQVNGGDVLHFFTDTANVQVSVRFYNLN